jgi:hypothetical protein
MRDRTPHRPPSDSDLTGAATEATRLRPRSEFESAIRAIIAELDEHPDHSYAIAGLHRRHQIKRRRLYDLLNVFSAIGCATRFGTQEIVWHGRDRIFPELLKHKQTTGLDNGALTLAALFPSDTSLSLPSLTVSFLLLFPALQVEVIDLRKASSFFSREGGKYKTTLCKLYQIALVLGTLNITERSPNVCEIRILPPLAAFLREVPDPNPFAIPNLLNRSADQSTVAEHRRAEFDGWSASRVTHD